jgi:hypothetical protein
LVVQRGNVGIGTTTPQAAFAVHEGNVGLGTITADGGRLIVMNGNVGIGTTTPQDKLVVTSGTVGLGTWTAGGRLIIQGGNVGIGTSIPGAKLQVNNTMTFFSEYDAGSQGGNFSIDWNNGNKQKVTLTGSAAHTITAFTVPTAGVANYLLRVIQGDAGNTITWPGTVKWQSGVAPTLTTTSGAVDIVSCYFDVTNYFCSSSLDFR